ncbi:hypothetical protein [uncultured Sphingobium sp.]|uniref:hypothetical protein n=1 Tax=uncultured Sphingobium sp. TaxID=316087 RepID=UPI00259BA1AB|nr:hypothetical protein [uncultured Sphingobium sp.]
MDYQLTTVAACRVARLDRQRFNEYVAGGDYTCAPKTIPGRSRLFDEADMIALCIFAQEIEGQMMKPLMAGLNAEAVLAALRKRPDADHLTFAHIWQEPMLRLLVDKPLPAGENLVGKSVIRYTVYDIAAVRAVVRKGVEQERAIIGPDD